ncbi:MAG: 30S ribosomal protein S9 [Actinobacteria bacterium]|nr:30S ribosomal protein S9 [Actinomycetota bacterium]
MSDEERQDTPQEEPGSAPEEESGSAQEEPGSASEDESGSTPEEAGGEPSADPGESPAAGDEDLSTTEDDAEEVTDAPEAAAEAPREERRPRRPPAQKKSKDEPEVIPGEHLAPDLVLEEQPAEGEFDQYADTARFEATTEEAGAPSPDEPASDEPGPSAEAPADAAQARSVVELAADARYQATGKRKTSVARVILRPGDGAYSVNGRSLEDYFPRAALQKAARQPLATAGFERRMDVIARIHGGGVSSQAGALRHGVARALVEADPALRIELKRRGFLSRDARAKERKKAGLKKARKRPQFSKR